MSDDWPSHREELTRKTRDNVFNLLHRMGEGEFTAREARLMLDAVYDTVSGLVDGDVLSLITDLQRELKKESGADAPIRRVFLKATEDWSTGHDHNVVITSTLPGAPTLLLRAGLKPDATWRVEEVKRFDDLAGLQNFETKLTKLLLSKDYRELIG